jgi:hypothetical protein
MNARWRATSIALVLTRRQSVLANPEALARSPTSTKLTCSRPARTHACDAARASPEAQTRPHADGHHPS